MEQFRDTLPIDPVCGMRVDHAKAAGQHQHRGVTYYLYGRSCLERFKADPEKYLAGNASGRSASPALVSISGLQAKTPEPSAQSRKPTAESLEAVPPGVEYTCPMHPEIIRPGPGPCPICGMALEPRMIAADEGPNPELIDMTRRFRIAATLAVPIVVLAMGDMVAGPGLGGRINLGLVNWIGLIVATPVVLWAGWPFFERGWASIVYPSPNTFRLIALGVGAAYAYSAAATAAPQIFPEGFRTRGQVQ